MENRSQPKSQPQSQRKSQPKARFPLGEFVRATRSENKNSAT